MDIILLERIEKLGTIGDLVTVKDGYARNYLLPNKKALRANEANRKVFEANRERLEKENAEQRTVSEKAGEKIAGTEIILLRASSNAGHLYGSVNVRDIVAGLEEKGHKVDRRQVILGHPIKTLGMFDVTIALHPEVHITVKANVARSEDEAELQSQGVDVIAQVFADEQAQIEEAAAEKQPTFQDGEIPSEMLEDEIEPEASEEASAEQAPAEDEAGDKPEG